MIDALVLKYLISLTKTTKERFFEHHEHRREVHHGKGKLSVLTVVIISVAWLLILGSSAAYFSWMSNSAIGWNIAMKLFFSLVAFLQGLTYLIIHIVNKLDLMLYIKRRILRGGVAAPRAADS